MGKLSRSNSFRNALTDEDFVQLIDRKLDEFDQKSLKIDTKNSLDPTPSLRAQLKRRCVCLSPTASPAPQGYHGSLASAVSCLCTSLLGSARRCFCSSTPNPKPPQNPKTQNPKNPIKEGRGSVEGVLCQIVVCCLSVRLSVWFVWYTCVGVVFLLFFQFNIIIL